MTLCHDWLTATYSYDPATGLFRNHRTNRVIGSLDKDGYVIIGLRPPTDRAVKSLRAHRIAWFYVHGQWPDHDIDHINGVRSDNRLSNLRPATDMQNLQNITRARCDNRVDLLGANYHTPSKKWRSQIRINKVKVHLGYYDTAFEAHVAYMKAKREHHPYGEIAKLPEWLLS